LKLQLIVLGKTSQHYVEDGVKIFEKRVSNFYKFSTVIINNQKIKSKDGEVVKKLEAKLLLPYFKKNTINILLDEKGKTFTSKQFANQLKNWMNRSPVAINFFVGGAFGFHQSIYDIAQHKTSLSTMTFSHQLIRLIFMEQLYRAVSIIQGLPYHNE